MPFPEIRKLPCKLERLFDETNIIPNFVYFNPSSAYPYIYVRATEKIEEKEKDTNTNEFKIVHINHMFLYNYHTNKMELIDIPIDTLKLSYNLHQGIEDTRLIVFEEKLWFLSTSTHASSSMQSEILLGYFNKTDTRIEFSQHLDFRRKPLKNMCPFIYEGSLHTIDMYSFELFKIQKESLEDKNDKYIAVNIGTLKPCNGIRSHTVRGSTSPIRLHGYLWGCVVHEHIPRATKGSFAYVSYWLEFDMNRRAITFLSAPFYISYLGIEFISGIEYDPKEDKIELYLGIQDKNPIVAYTTLHDIRVGAESQEPKVRSRNVYKEIRKTYIHNT